MLKDITFGQYFVADSPIHKLDARAKILLLIFIIVLIFISGNFVSLALVTLLSVLTMGFSGVPLKLYFKNIKIIIPIVLFTAILNMFYTQTGAPLLPESWFFQIYSGGLIRACFMALRVILLIFVSLVLTYTTTPNDLTDAIERLLKPLKLIGLGEVVHTMSMMMTIALRFIPTLIEETYKIMNAQKARGADLENGGIVKKVKALLPILIPLLISAVRRAYELAEAMECRCYNGGKGRKRMKQLKLSGRDFVAFLVNILFLAAIIVSNIFIKIGVV
jgi:energy-coupling factor transport system permease protein